jgi:hypothetical protein
VVSIKIAYTKHTLAQKCVCARDYKYSTVYKNGQYANTGMLLEDKIKNVALAHIKLSGQKKVSPNATQDLF